MHQIYLRILCNCRCDGNLTINKQLLQATTAGIDVVGVIAIGDCAVIRPGAIGDRQGITGITIDQQLPG